LSMHRTEKDSLGTVEIPTNALYGIHSVRAAQNFPFTSRFPESWYKAMGLVKYSCYEVYRRFKDAARDQYDEHPGVKIICDDTLNAISAAAKKISEGEQKDMFIVPAIQGGAGTSHKYEY
jgi:aspartate ammonia-lyase